MNTRATGTFEVNLTPQPKAAGEEPSLSRLLLAKQFQGDLEGSAQGQMLAARTGVDNSAGYVALERVTGALHGQRGSFVLQHGGLMNRGAGQLSITVVPDSGSDALAGLAGSMTIAQDADGKHTYVFEYTLRQV